MKTIMTIGGATQDIFLQQRDCQALPQHQDSLGNNFLLVPQGSKIELSAVHYALGGGATNTAMSFKQQGFAVTCFFKRGNDRQGEFITQKLQSAGIDSSFHATSLTQQTGTSFILPACNERTLLVYRGASSDITSNDLPLAAIAQQQNLYITSLSGSSAEHLATIVHHARATSNLIALNPGMQQLRNIKLLVKALRSIDIFIVNGHEARTLFQYFVTQVPKSSFTIKEPLENSLLHKFYYHDGAYIPLQEFFKIILSQGPTIAVVTNGSEGVYVGTPDKIYFHPSITLQQFVNKRIINTVGAGDAFGSTFVGSLIMGYSIEQALVRGNINSNSVVHHQDAQSGLLTQQELTAYADIHGTKQIMTFDVE